MRAAAASIRFRKSRRRRFSTPLLFWHYDLSPRTRSVIFCCFFVLFWLLASLRLFFAERVPQILLAVVGGIALVFLGSLLVERATESCGGVVVARAGDRPQG